MELITFDTPVGPLALAEEDEQLTRLWLPGQGYPRIAERETALLSEGKRQLLEYLTGLRRMFSLPLSPAGTFFQRSVWQALEEKINALPSSQAALADVLLAYAAPCEPDSQSRILVPQTLREYAGLGRDVVITGSSNKAKIWDKETWERRSAPQLDPAKVADMFDMLGL